MKTTDCRSVTNEINASELHQQLSREAAEHLAGCASCRKVSEQGASLHALVASLGGATAPADFDMRLRARLAREKESNSVWLSFWRPIAGAPAFGLAFSLLVIVGLAIYVLPGNQQRVRETQTASVGGTKAGTTQPPPVEVVKTAAPDVVPDETGRRPLRPRDASVVKSGSAGMLRAGSREYSSLPAVTVKNTSNSPTADSPVVALSAPLQPVVVSMRDDRGATRRISIPPVSFGSQKIIQPSYQPVSLASSKGAW
ncbi:MAG: hypothetical protein QOD75_2342 [Blastocatellia bacterium]|jgi:hypothetical protein|nr:hypothetical protein [Blastocatellia bacterium]